MVVGHQWGQASHELLKTLITDPAPRFETIHGMGHSSDPDELDLVKQFLEERLS
jgi:predicted esterase